jgi:hypothetical protein
MQIAEPLVPAPTPCEVEITTVKLKRHKSSGSDQIPAQLIQEGDETLRPESHKLIKYIWNKEELSQRWDDAIIVINLQEGETSMCVLRTIFNVYFPVSSHGLNLVSGVYSPSVL